MRDFSSRFSVTAETLVLDVGGLPQTWSLTHPEPRVVFTNIALRRNVETGRRRWVLADARRLPFRDGAFDVLFSNSVIEHVGARESQARFASECRRVARRYYVQTPNRRFIVEPHLYTPFVHWLPRPVMRKLLRNFTVWGLVTRPSDRWCEGFMDEVWMLDERDMRQMFPDATIVRERLIGMTKSLIAVGSAGPA